LEEAREAQAIELQLLDYGIDDLENDNDYKIE
jgi:hypothetical protein